MTEHRISPLQWLSTKFASLNHTHNQYLTQHQSLKTINNETITGTGNINIETGSDVDIVTDWESTLSDEKVASEKLVKESIDSVLYETEELELGTPTMSSNVEFKFSYYGDNSFTVSTLNTVGFPSPSFPYGSYDSMEIDFDISFPSQDFILIFYSAVANDLAIFRYNGSTYFGRYNQYEEYNLVDVAQLYMGSKLTLQFSNYGIRAFFNDEYNTYVDIEYSSYEIKYSDNITINSITAKNWNIQTLLSRFVDDIQKIEHLMDGADLDDLYSDKIYLGNNNIYEHISNCPVENASFVLINRNITSPGESSNKSVQQVLMTKRYGENIQLWVRFHYQYGGGEDWIRLATTDDIPSLDSLKQITTKYFKSDDFINPNCWYTDWDNHSYRPTYSNNTLSFNNRSWYLFNFDGNYELLDDYTMEILYSIVGSPMLLINGTTIPLSSNSNRIYIYTNGGNTYIEYDSESTQTITGKIETFQVRINNSSSSFEITNFTFNGSYPSNNLWDRKQDVLVSGTNLKTINNQSLLGNGNISISGGSGGSVTVDSTWVNNSTNPVESQLIKTALDSKSDTSHTHSNYANSSHTHTTTDITDLSIPTQSTQINTTFSNNDLKTATQYVSSGGVITQQNFNQAVNEDLGDIWDTMSYIGHSHTISDITDLTIVDNLSTNDSTKVLSAKQGKVLNDLIGQAISYINQ